MEKLANTTGLQLFKYLEFRRDPLAWLYETRKLGDIVTINPRSKTPSYVIHSPEAVKEILTTKDECFRKGASARTLAKTIGDGVLTTEGEQHQRQRKMLQPAFHKKRIASYAESVSEYVIDMASSWTDGEVYQINQEMMDLTLRVIVKTMFGVDVKGELRGVTQAVNDIIEKTASNLLSPVPFPDFVPTEQNRKYRKGVKTLDELADELIIFGQKERQEDNLLSMLLEARYENGEPISRKEIRDQVVTIVIGGHETTANLLTWVWYLLAKHPHIEEQLHKELDAVLRGCIPRFDDIPNLVYTNQIIQEALRLYPPGWIVMREAEKDVEIAGHPFKKGSIFLVSPYVVHRNEKFFPQPEEFQPKRFAKDRQSTIASYAYFPFGAGSRGCIGSQFAMMETVLIIATVAQRYVLRMADENQEVKPEPLVSLRIRGGLPMKVIRR